MSDHSISDPSSDDSTDSEGALTPSESNGFVPDIGDDVDSAATAKPSNLYERIASSVSSFYQSVVASFTGSTTSSSSYSWDDGLPTRSSRRSMSSSPMDYSRLSFPSGASSGYYTGARQTPSVYQSRNNSMMSRTSVPKTSRRSVSFAPQPSYISGLTSPTERPFGHSSNLFSASTARPGSVGSPYPTEGTSLTSMPDVDDYQPSRGLSASHYTSQVPGPSEQMSASRGDDSRDDEFNEFVQSALRDSPGTTTTFTSMTAGGHVITIRREPTVTREDRGS